MYTELEYNRISDSSDEATYDEDGVLRRLTDLDHSSDSEVASVVIYFFLIIIFLVFYF